MTGRGTEKCIVEIAGALGGKEQTFERDVEIIHWAKKFEVGIDVEAAMSQNDLITSDVGATRIGGSRVEP
jgi:hypothetical protein